MSRAIKDVILDAAGAVDAGDHAEARRVLLGAPLGAHEPHVRQIYFALWRRLVTEANEGVSSIAQEFDAIERTFDAPDRIWDAETPIKKMSAEIGPAEAAAIAAIGLWTETLSTKSHFFRPFFEVVAAGDNIEQIGQVWREYLAERPDFAPDHWIHLTAIRARGLQSHPDFPAGVMRELRDLGRDDLAPLASVQLGFMRQEPFADVSQRALALGDPTHRALVADYLLGGPIWPGESDRHESVFAQLLPADAPDAGPKLGLMRARAAAALGDWAGAFDAAQQVRRPDFARREALALMANAQARLGRYEAARRNVRKIAREADAPTPVRVRAKMISAMTELLAADRPPPDATELPDMPVVAGRPLAMSLWVGPRLRWVERLSIASYLRNGWRYQLYVYDLPEGVPSGCEVMDAEGILPGSMLFREGGSSGWHKGSLGAFSDLFRYALLLQRGGLWTDTDVLNRRRFEPDGRHFMSTEMTDGGHFGPNGALLAAPAGSPFMEKALRRARALVDEKKLGFARIGPELLAEMIAEHGPGRFELLPQNFMNPIPWLRTATLLEPHERVEALTEIQAAANIHLYTETWRMIGLSLDRPPSAETFLGKTYADVFGEEALKEAARA